MKPNLGLSLCSFLMSATNALPAGAQGPGRFFGPENYPAEAARLHQQGRVVMHLIISITGNVKTCTVTTSSGSASLDMDACDKALRKFRFTPAKDGAGQPVEGTYDLSVRYVLPSDAPAQPLENSTEPLKEVKR